MPFQRLHAVATTIVVRKFIETIGDGRCICCRDVATTVAHIVRRWRGVEVELAIEEEKQLVFDYRTSERNAVNLRLLLGKFCPIQRTATIEVVVVSVVIGAVVVCASITAFLEISAVGLIIVRQTTAITATATKLTDNKIALRFLQNARAFFNATTEE